MTYYSDLDAAQEESPFQTHEVCLCCGEPTSGPIIGYDVVMPGTTIYTRALLHRDCAFAMAQRIICDAWPNRRAGEGMKTDR